MDHARDDNASRPLWAFGGRRLPPGTGDVRAPMPTERERFHFLGSTQLLGRLDERVLWALAYEGVNEELEPRAVVIREGEGGGDESMRFYLVREGEAIVSTTEPLPGSWTDAEDITYAPDGSRVAFDHVTGGRIIARLAPGDFFGESALLTQSHRSATVRAGTDGLELVSFDAQSFHTRIAEHVLVFRMVKDEFAAGSAPDVARMGIFNELPMRDLAVVLHEARQETHALGDAIVTQGDPGDRFYVILDGAVRVEKDGELVAELERGDYFGETALLLGIPRTATVRAAAKTMVWSITQDAFNLVMRSHLLKSLAAEPQPERHAAYRPMGAGASLAARLRGGG